MRHKPHTRTLPTALLGLSLLLGCTAEDPVGIGSKPNGSTSTPGTGSTSPNAGSPTPTIAPTASPTTGATPTPTPSPTPTTLTGGTDTEGGTDPVPTISPPTQPTPGATPLGTVGPELFVSGGVKAIAIPSNATQPWIVRAIDLAQLDSSAQILKSFSTGLSQPGPLRAQGADLWVADGTTLHRLAPNAFAADGLSNVSSYPIAANANSLAVDAAEAWVTHVGGTLTRITRSSGASQTFTVTDPLAIALDGTHAWITGSPDTLYKVDRLTGATSTFTVGADPVAVAVDGSGTVWTANKIGQSLSRLSSGATTPTTIALGGTPAALVIDTNRLWVALSSPRKVAWYSLDGTLQGTSNLPLSPQAMALDAVGRLWLADPLRNSLTFVWGQ